MALCFLCYWHKEFYGNEKSKLLVFIQAAAGDEHRLITAIALAHPASITNQKAKDESCSSRKKINADVLNSITVKLM